MNIVVSLMNLLNWSLLLLNGGGGGGLKSRFVILGFGVYIVDVYRYMNILIIIYWL